jgi:hypothetical protein
MSLDVHLSAVRKTEVYSANITHNLGSMAKAAGIYEHLWRPEEIGVMYARELIAPLSEGLAKLKADPEKYSNYDAPNGWGRYVDFVPWLEQYIEACQENPDAEVSASR